MAGTEGLGYEAWLRTVHDKSVLRHWDDLDTTNSRAAGVKEFSEEVFRARGPVSVEEFRQAFDERQLRLAQQAVELVEADIGTAGIGAMSFDVSLRPLRDGEDDEFLVVSHRGSFQTPVMFSLRHPESTVEVADNMQDHVVDELHGAWPVCPEHDRGSDARMVDGDAVWYCKSGAHVVAVIGQLTK